jgi:hypothetical protein
VETAAELAGETFGSDFRVAGTLDAEWKLRPAVVTKDGVCLEFEGFDLGVVLGEKIARARFVFLASQSASLPAALFLCLLVPASWATPSCHLAELDEVACLASLVTDT